VAIARAATVLATAIVTCMYRREDSADKKEDGENEYVADEHDKMHA
jgi:hypothetical protein